MSRKAVQKMRQSRRSFPEEFKREAVAMLLDGHSAPSVAERLGLSNPSRNTLLRSRDDIDSVLIAGNELVDWPPDHRVIPRTWPGNSSRRLASGSVGDYSGRPWRLCHLASPNEVSHAIDGV